MLTEYCSQQGRNAERSVNGSRQNKTKYKISQNISNKMQRYTIYFSWKLIDMFRDGTIKPGPTLPRQRQISVTVWRIPGAVDTVIGAPDDG